MKSVAIPRALLAALSFAVAASASARPGDTALLPEVVGTAQLYAANPHSGLALNGRDPVSYQTDAGPRPGRPPHEAVWGGLGWRFTSAANRAAFLRSPESFAPRLGGYDAEAAADGRLVEADPEIFVVRSGRLYFFRNAAARARFMADPGAASRAEVVWPRIGGRLVRG